MRIRKSSIGSSRACTNNQLSSKNISPPCPLNQNPWDVPSYADSFVLADISYNQVNKSSLMQKTTTQTDWSLISKSTVGSQSQYEDMNIDDTIQNNLVNKVDKEHSIERISPNVDKLSSNHEEMANLNCNKRILEPLCIENANKASSSNSYYYDNNVSVANNVSPISNFKSLDLNKFPDKEFNYLEGEFKSNLDDDEKITESSLDNSVNDNVINVTCPIKSRGKLGSIDLNKHPYVLDGQYFDLIEGCFQTSHTSLDLNKTPSSEIDYEEFDCSNSINLTSFDLNKTPPRVCEGDNSIDKDIVESQSRLDLNKTPDESEEEFDYFEGNIDLNADINPQV